MEKGKFRLTFESADQLIELRDQTAEVDLEITSSEVGRIVGELVGLLGWSSCQVLAYALAQQPELGTIDDEYILMVSAAQAIAERYDIGWAELRPKQ